MPKNKKPAGGRPAKNFEPRYGAKKTGGPSAGSRSPGHRGFRAEPAEAPRKNRWNSEDRDARRSAPAGERPAYGDRAPRGDRNERPAYNRGERSERPRFDRDARAGDRPSYGDRGPRPDRGGVRPSYGDRSERPRLGDRGGRPDRWADLQTFDGFRRADGTWRHRAAAAGCLLPRRDSRPSHGRPDDR